MDYIEKPFSIQVLKEKIKALIRDHDMYTERELEKIEGKIRKVLRKKENSYVKFDRAAIEYNLSNREREVVQYVIKGVENREIAE
ncbi:MAG: hypothetical protein JXJ04_03470 [Spirochaetales bacterium]|nr:hypothetical protein [Spirochaetales bacterium]